MLKLRWRLVRFLKLLIKTLPGQHNALFETNSTMSAPNILKTVIGRRIFEVLTNLLEFLFFIDFI